MTHLHIEHLILDPTLCAPADRRRLKAALQQELERLLTAQALSLQTGQQLDLLDVPQTVVRDRGIESLARGLAGSLHGGLLHV